MKPIGRMHRRSIARKKALRRLREKYSDMYKEWIDSPRHMKMLGQQGRVCNCMMCSSREKYKRDKKIKDEELEINTPKPQQMTNKKELTIQIVNGELQITIGIDTLAFAIKNSPMLDSYGKIKIVDVNTFARAMMDALCVEEEDGTTPIHRIFDNCASQLIEQGDESIDIDEDGYEYE